MSEPTELGLARLVRFYGIDPARAMELPQWLMALLARQMARLEAEQMLRQMMAAMAPQMRPAERRRLIARLEHEARPREPRPAVEVVKHDPQAAREWFEAHGVKAV